MNIFVSLQHETETNYTNRLAVVIFDSREGTGLRG